MLIPILKMVKMIPLTTNLIIPMLNPNMTLILKTGKLMLIMTLKLMKIMKI